ncbi:EamA family transporter [Pseudomonas daroniae]|uniref:EamA family transporter n=1 Tax=Phytopseudomonas daroniae TaxID=2487519 RepID=A0A4Q9QIH9_9GAMM|nr:MULTISPECIES: DMT family transporter [Pseudomonas]TBU75773.1 EamA family transporter [Pseudomonas daroniae]TBU80568.1 EamA family transporter [Pseudomonas sp. FRB 228]TBU89607.1 EamA family transporter [Pseudomonas daroniae]
MDTRKNIDGLAGAMMVILCMIWGMQQVVLKAAADDVSPTLMLALRSGVAAVLVALLMLWRRDGLSLREGNWRPGLMVGFLFALEFMLVGEGLRHTSASHMVIFLYTAPIFAALGLHWRLPAERLKPLQWLGITVAFVGIVVSFAGRAPDLETRDTSQQMFGDILGLLGAMAWGATTVVVRCSRLSTAPVTQTLLYQLLGGFLLLMLVCTLTDQLHFNPTPVALGGLAFQALLVSFASFLAWFWLLRNYLASRLGVLSFMTPMFGIVFGVWLLDEPLEANFIAGALLVLSGILMVSGYEWLSQWLKRRRLKP